MMFRSPGRDDGATFRLADHPVRLLLLLIATMPLTPPRVKHLWSIIIRMSRRTAPPLQRTISREFPAGRRAASHAARILLFIVLIGSLFVVAGGIHR
jgi:hypothetical protein